jgi:acyl-CoA synthetase (AMP-forming)/AMP-acid ligase II
MCVRRVDDDARRELDLTCVRHALNGSEPVRAATLDRFCAAFAASGFRREAFSPCYGLAEATLYVSGGHAPDEPPRVGWFDLAALSAHRVAAAEPGGPGAVAIVSCGGIDPTEKVRAVDPATATAVAPSVIGEIWVAGRSVAAGYFDHPDDTGATFGARLPGEPDARFLRTGDLGFLEGGELYITGRLRDLVIIHGRKHHPHDLEETVRGSHPQLEGNECAAFAIDGERAEELVLVVELPQARASAGTELRGAIREALARIHQVAVRDVHFVPRRALPRTTSGKLQRFEVRARYLSASLETWPEPG